MYEFRKASRTAEQMASDKAELAEIFNVVKKDDGSLDKTGVMELKKHEMALGEIIFQLLSDTTLTTDPTPLLVDTIDANITDDYVWQEITSALRVVDRAYGSKPQSQRLSFSEFSMTTSPREMVVEVPLEQIASGRYNPALISDVMNEARTRFTLGMILDAIDAGVTAGNDRSGKAGYTVRYTGLTQANLDNAIDGLMDEGQTPTLFGRWLALTPIRGFAGWATMGSEAALREIEQRGLVGSYHSMPIVTLQDKWNKRTSSHVLRYDRVYMAGGQKGAMYMRKNLGFLDFAEVLPAEGVFRVGVRWEDGVFVWDKYQYRIITVS